MTDQPAVPNVAYAQRLRLQRMTWGFMNQACSLTIVLALTVAGMLPMARSIEYVLAIGAIDVVFVALLKSNLNLRFRDPSMTAAQITVPIWPGIYMMYFVTVPQARMAFLLMATGGLLFGMFAMDRRGMLKTGGIIVFAYVLLVATLQRWAPERVDLRVEAIIVFAYGSVLAIVAYLGSFIAGLRTSLKARNQSLQQAMVKLEDLATRDPLTRLPNRRSVMDQLAREKSRVERRTPDDDALCVSILDIDHFKRINDNYGHQVGDAVLSRIGAALQSALRQGDFVGRYGGEEFVLILPETSNGGAFAAAERVREIIAGLSFPELPPNERITVSQGIADHKAGNDVDDTLKRADDALYLAKSQGRNRVVKASAPGVAKD